mgnify:CR=1 FL=1
MSNLSFKTEAERDKKIVVTASLTAHRYDLYQKRLEIFDKNNVWTYDGIIRCVKGKGKLIIECEEDHTKRKSSCIKFFALDLMSF